MPFWAVIFITKRFCVLFCCYYNSKWLHFCYILQFFMLIFQKILLFLKDFCYSLIYVSFIHYLFSNSKSAKNLLTKPFILIFACKKMIGRFGICCKIIFWRLHVWLRFFSISLCYVINILLVYL